MREGGVLWFSVQGFRFHRAPCSTPQAPRAWLAPTRPIGLEEFPEEGVGETPAQGDGVEGLADLGNAVAFLEQTVLEFLLHHHRRHQGEAGAWWPTWAWGEPFAAAWPAARQAWAGMLTLDRLLLLARFGRLERG